MSKIITMGEMMARFMPQGNLTIEQAPSFDVYFGGDESIVASSLARFGLEAGYVTRLPENILGDRAVSTLRANGVDVSHVVRGGERFGINFYENGASVRPSKVVYDRKYSSMSAAGPEDFDFEKIFDHAQWFHVSGITPALGPGMKKAVKTAMEYARKKGITVSYDFNYRGKLWSPAQARETALELLPYVDVLMGIGIGDSMDPDLMLGYAPPIAPGSYLDGNLEAFEKFFKDLSEAYDLRYITSTMRTSLSASDNLWSAVSYCRESSEFYKAKEYSLHLVDRGGGGAAYCAGFIYGCVSGFGQGQTTEFAAAAGALKQTIMGDFNLAGLQDVQLLAGGDGTGRVQR